MGISNGAVQLMKFRVSGLLGDLNQLQVQYQLQILSGTNTGDQVLPTSIFFLGGPVSFRKLLFSLSGNDGVTVGEKHNVSGVVLAIAAPTPDLGRHNIYSR